MPLVKAQCPNCGGALEVDDAKEAAVCPFCQTPYIVEKAINNYTTNVTNNIQANTVIVQGTAESEFEIDKVTLKKYVGHNKNVTIPDYIETIENSAFYDCSWLTSVSIPDSVESIEELAFYGCSKLTSVTIGNGVTSIGGSAFSGCSRLTSILVKEGNVVFHSSGNCLIETASKTLIQGCKTSAIPIDGSVTSIGDEAFSDCSGLTSVTIGDGVKSIGDLAFSGCSGLTSVTIGNSVTSIGNSAFSGCSGLTSVTIGDGVTSIGNNAFSGCSGLTSVTIPDSVTSIGNNAFSGCSGLTSVTIGDGVTSIGDYAFRDCSSLTEITIPESITSIGILAFCGCSSLTSVTIVSTATIIGRGAFINTPVEKQFSKGCYVATCVYGSYDCPQVWTLRRYRDDTLASTWYGRLFIHFYYAVSPMLVKWFGKTRWFKKMWKGKLDRMVKRLNDSGVENTPYQDKNW